jgi:hypothetical protein
VRSIRVRELWTVEGARLSAVPARFARNLHIDAAASTSRLLVGAIVAGLVALGGAPGAMINLFPMNIAA